MAKRGENIYKRKDGRWEGRYPKGHGKYGYIYGNTYKDVKKRLNIAKASDERDRKDGKISELCDGWLNSKKEYIKESSFAKYKSITEKHIKPYFSNMPISRVDGYAAEEFVKALCKKGYSPKTVKLIISVLEGVFFYSGIRMSFSFKQLIPRAEQKSVNILSNSERIRLEKHLASSNDACCLGVLTALYTGIRIGELCALKWENIDLVRGFVKITATLQRIQSFGGEGNKKTKVIITDPKTPSAKRVIPLPEFLIERLKVIKAEDKNAFLLTGNQRYIEPRTLSNIFKKYSADCNINAVSFHSLRHTFTTRCVELDFETKTLSEILGHSSISTTLGIYTHPSFKSKRESINRLRML